MGRIGKSFTLVFILLLAVSSPIIIKAASAQTIPTPSIPEFTTKLVDLSYNVPATTTIDPYTGQTVNNPAHHVENYTIDVTIKNQPYTSTKVQNGSAYWTTSFVYQIQVKGHFAQDWIPMYALGEGPIMSNTDYTVVTYLLILSEQGYELTSHDSTLSTNTVTGLPPNAQIDFQVEALSGYWTRTMQFDSQHFVAQESGWSNKQTVTIPASSSLPTPTPAVPEFPTLIILPLFAVATLLPIVFIKKKSEK